METTEARPRRKPGRPPKMAGRPFQTVSVALPPEDILRLEQEARAQGDPSLSAQVRRAVIEYLRRLEKRRDRQERQAGQE